MSIRRYFVVRGKKKKDGDVGNIVDRQGSHIYSMQSA